MNVGGYRNHFLMTVLNIHAPIQHKRIKGNSIPWITPEIKYMMRNRDYHKKQAMKHASESHWKSYQVLRNKVNVAMRNPNISTIKYLIVP
jgi:hypothetical protein